MHKHALPNNGAQKADQTISLNSANQLNTTEEVLGTGQIKDVRWCGNHCPYFEKEIIQLL